MQLILEILWYMYSALESHQCAIKYSIKWCWYNKAFEFEFGRKKIILTAIFTSRELLGVYHVNYGETLPYDNSETEMLA